MPRDRGRRNAAIFLVDAAGTPSGYSLVSPQILLPALLSQMGASNALIGLIPAIAGFGGNLPPLFTAPSVERSVSLKRRLALFSVLERLPFLLLGLSLPAAVDGRPGMAVALILACWAASNLIMGCNLPVYYSALARETRADQRGRLFGLGGALGGLLGVVAAGLAAFYLRAVPFPWSYVRCFTTGFLWLALAVVPFVWLDESLPGAQEVAVLPDGTGRGSGGVLSALREDSPFRKVVLAEAALITAVAGTAFLAVASEQRLGFDAARLGRYNLTTMIFSCIFGLALGWAADRWGHRPVLITSGLLSVLSALAALAAGRSEVIWHVAFACGAAANLGLKISGMNIALELSGPRRAATYSALVMAAPLPARVGAPVLAGLLADGYGFAWVFALCGAAGLLAALLFAGLRAEPRLARTAVSPW